VIICSYTGIHFVDVNCDPKTLVISIALNDLSYETEQFVNKVIEYDKGLFLAVAWDNNKFIFIDNKLESVDSIILHPKNDNFNIRCWGLEKVPDFDLKKCPFIVARDNIGIVLIDVA